MVVFPEDQDEMSPEQMLAENMQQENQNSQSSSVPGEVMEQEQIRNCYPESYWIWIITNRFTVLLPSMYQR